MHPERYGLVEQMARDLGTELAKIVGDPMVNVPPGTRTMPAGAAGSRDDGGCDGVAHDDGAAWDGAPYEAGSGGMPGGGPGGGPGFGPGGGPGGVVDVSGLAREAIVLATPSRIVCNEGCLGLCPECGRDRNQGPCACPAPGPDDRWAKLKDFAGDNLPSP